MWWTKLTRNTYRRNITYLQSRNRGRDSEIMSGLFDNNKSILKRCDERNWTLTVTRLTPAVTCALAVASLAGMDGMRSVLVKNVDIEVTCPCTCIEPRDGFLDLEILLKKRFISLMIKVKEIALLLTKLSIIAVLVPHRHIISQGNPWRIALTNYLSIQFIIRTFRSILLGQWCDCSQSNLLRRFNLATNIVILLEINFIQEQLTRPKFQLVCAVFLS